MAFPSFAPALGILVPREVGASPIRLGPTDVEVTVQQNLARTRVKQEFFNPNPRQLEADFFFPVPRGADVTDFVLYMNGKPVKGEVLEKQKAREIYEGIVRRMQDPGLLEWADYNLFKVRVFPVPPNGSQKIELEFAQPLEADQGTFKYTFPLHPPKPGMRPAGRTAKGPDLDFRINLISDEPLRNVYSPTHPVDVDMKNPSEVRVGLKSPDVNQAGGDFVLYYQPGRKEVALSLVGYRPTPSGDGFFSMMISPPAEAGSAQVQPQDVVFVVDTSGSMLEGDKIEQARRALTYCVSQLRPEDRFALVRFSTETEKFREGLLAADKENIEAARHWIGALQARGGTNIAEALEEAMALRPAASSSDGRTTAPDRLFTTVFITDGLPTVGVTDPDRIVESALGGEEQGEAGKSPSQVRIFTFGVGHDVNTRLLDRLADETRAASEYIRPGEDLEAPVSRFFDKIGRPAMTGLKLEIAGAEVADLYPKELPDLFYGTQLTLFGRYRKAGPATIRLTGTVGGKPAEFTWEKSFPEQEKENDYVEKLWGTRKIAYLLDSIRKSGESAEVKEEVVRLAKKYGVVTPYTSYLVTEDTPHLAGAAFPQRNEVERRDQFSRRPGLMRSGPARPVFPAAAAPSGARAGAGHREAAAAPPPGAPMDLAAQSGASAVRASEQLREMKQADVRQATPGEARTAGGRSFRLEDGIWTDTTIEPADPVILRIRYLSRAWFEAAEVRSELREILALGEKVRVKLGNGVLEIGSEGEEMLSEKQRESLSQLRL